MPIDLFDNVSFTALPARKNKKSFSTLPQANILRNLNPLLDRKHLK